MTKVEVKLFAAARQAVGQETIQCELPPDARVSDLRQAMMRAHAELAPIVPRSMIAVNQQYAADQLVLPAGAEIALIPPVSGG